MIGQNPGKSAGEKIAATIRAAWHQHNDRFGSFVNRSSMDAILVNVKTAEESMHHKKTYR